MPARAYAGDSRLSIGGAISTVTTLGSARNPCFARINQYRGLVMPDGIAGPHRIRPFLAHRGGRTIVDGGLILHGVPETTNLGSGALSIGVLPSLSCLSETVDIEELIGHCHSAGAAHQHSSTIGPAHGQSGRQRATKARDDEPAGSRGAPLLALPFSIDRLGAVRARRRRFSRSQRSESRTNRPPSEGSRAGPARRQ